MGSRKRERSGKERKSRDSVIKGSGMARIRTQSSRKTREQGDAAADELGRKRKRNPAREKSLWHDEGREVGESCMGDAPRPCNFSPSDNGQLPLAPHASTHSALKHRKLYASPYNDDQVKRLTHAESPFGWRFKTTTFNPLRFWTSTLRAFTP